MEQNVEGKTKENKNRNAMFKGAGVILISFVIGNVSARYGLFIGPNSSEYSKAVKYADDYSTYAGLFEARQTLIDNYNGDVNDSVLLDGAIKGMASSLKDPYTMYMTQEEYNKFTMSNAGLRIGIGVTISVKNEKLVIEAVEDGKPANEANILAGDIIVKVDGEEIGGDISKAVSLISNTNSDTTVLTIEREGTENFDVEVKKEEIRTESVSGEMIDENIGYIRLKDFNENSSTEFIDMLSSLIDSGMNGVIFDLRGNGGGYLTEAVNIASQFIPKDEVITTLNNKFNKEKVSVSKGGIAENMPVVLLVDSNTASASEVVTGALRDHNIAVTVGTNTYGKGVAQSTFKVKNTQGAIKITIDNFYTPNGENINKVGIKPDYEVTLTEEDVSGEYSKSTDPQFQKALEVIKEKSK